ncbi:MAG: LysM peptidoglycan-binding domain-containing protein [Muribaculaceae bacterium]|nr:LysM peptidoglycan-binding domain-containing protein [Muribaculaceae bacterium]
MNLNKIILLIIATIGIVFAPAAQTGLPTMRIAGNDYYYYEVKNKDTLFGIAKALGTTQDEILRYNPDAARGLAKRQLIFLPVIDKNPDKHVRSAFGGSTVAATTPQAQQVNHTIGAGEDLYSIAKAYNTSIEGLLRANLRLRPEDYTPGTTIKVKPNSALPFAYERKSVSFHSYIVQGDESFYSIARRNGITEADLQAANPELKKPRNGKLMTVPRMFSETLQGDMRTISLAELTAYYSPRINDIYARVAENEKSSAVNIGVILPFQLQKKPAPRQAYLYNDFYKGLLMAMDSAGSQCSRHINLRVWDTQHNLNVTDSLLALPEMQTLDLIIAPSEPKQLERINNYGKAQGIQVLNCFSAKNEDFNTNPQVIQVNTPAYLMSKQVLDWFDEKFAGYKVIYLMDASSEGKDVFDQLKEHIAQQGTQTITIKVTGEISDEDISREMDPASHYVFVPSSSNKELLRKVVKALKSVKGERIDCEMSLIGFPEYVLYLKDYQTDLMDIDTYVFSRFFNAKGFRTRDIEAMYKKWFDGDMLASVPNMGLFGFDTGIYLIKTLGNGIEISSNAPLHKGIQTSFKFEATSNGSLVNRAIDIIHFTPDHQIFTNVKE